MIKKLGSHTIAMIYPNLCYNEVCYEGTVLYAMNTKISCTGLYMFQLAVSVLNVYLFWGHSIWSDLGMLKYCTGSIGS